MPAVLLSAITPSAELREWLAAAGVEVRAHVLGSTPSVDFTALAMAVIEVGEKTDAALIQTRRWRAELGDDGLPIVWVLPRADAKLAAQGLEAGADVVMARPLEEAMLIAQVKSAVRARTSATRVAARANESRILGEHLQKALAEAERERSALRRVRLAFLQRSFPEMGAARFAVSYRPRARAGGDFYDLVPIDDNRVVFVIGDVIGADAASELIGNLVARIAARTARQSHLAGDVLASVNRQLLGLGLEEPPLVAMVVGILEPNTGLLSLARAGLPAPVCLSRSGGSQAWTIPGPFLGTTETTYATFSSRLCPGDKLLIGTDGIRPDGNPNPTGGDALVEAAERHRALDGQSFVDAVANDLLAKVRHHDDVTLFLVELVRNQPVT
jgi:sigma-B regulation protein RsbU (phosphoserine phosphatase)